MSIFLTEMVPLGILHVFVQPLSRRVRTEKSWLWTCAPEEVYSACWTIQRMPMVWKRRNSLAFCTTLVSVTKLFCIVRCLRVICNYPCLHTAIIKGMFLVFPQYTIIRERFTVLAGSCIVKINTNTSTLILTCVI